MLKHYITVVSRISCALAFLAAGLIFAAMVVVCQMILMRYIFRQPTIWQTDFVIFSATAAIFLGAPYVLLKGGHVGVDLVELMLGEKARKALRLVAQLLGLTFCAAMLVASWIQFHEAWTYSWRHSSVWAPPLWIPLITLPIGFAMLCLQYLAEMAKGLIGEEAAEPAAVDDIPGITATSALKETSR